MLKQITYLPILLLSVLCFGQSKDVALKIYLEDAYSGKKIKDAKVTLEGFKIPEIVGTYDKKGKFYYFTEIPEGYTTLMAYHKKYNEKGFQYLDKLQNKEIALKICPLYNVSYSFANNDIYVEDINKILVISNKRGTYITIRDSINNIMDKLGLVAVNPYYPNSESMSLEELYPNCDFSKSMEQRTEDWIIKKHPCSYLPLNGTCLGEVIYDYNLSYSNDIADEQSFVFIYVKKDGTPFKRFNDPILWELSKIGTMKTFLLVYNKIRYRGAKKYNTRNFKDIDQIFFDWKKNNKHSFYPTHFSRIAYTSNEFNLKHALDSIREQSKYVHKVNDYTLIPVIYNQTFGLGILDVMDYYQIDFRSLQDWYLYKYQKEIAPDDGYEDEGYFWNKEEYVNFKNK